MNQKLVEEKFEHALMNEWTVAKPSTPFPSPFTLKCDEIWLYKTDESRILVRANTIVEQKVVEYMADIQRVHSGFKIGAPIIYCSDLDEIKRMCEKELKFIESISIPNRDLDSLYRSEPIEEPNRLSRVD